METSRSSSGNKTAGGSELCAGEYFLFYFWIYVVRIDSADSADAAATVWIYRDGCRAGAGTGSICGRDVGTSGGQDFAESGSETASGIRISCIRAGDVAVREFYVGHGLST